MQLLTLRGTHPPRLSPPVGKLFLPAKQSTSDVMILASQEALNVRPSCTLLMPLSYFLIFAELCYCLPSPQLNPRQESEMLTTLCVIIAIVAFFQSCAGGAAITGSRAG